jgi:hypothetical protein
MSLRTRCAALALALAAGACASAAQPGSAPEPGGRSHPARPADVAPQEQIGAFVVTIGRDTLAVERYVRIADRLTGTVVSRSPRTVTRTYTAALRPDGSVSRLEVTTTPPNGTQPPTVAVTEFTADSAVSRFQRGDSTWSARVAASGRVMPLVGSSNVMFEQAMMQARAAGLDSASFVLVAPGNPQTYPMSLRMTADSARIDYIAGVQLLATDARGRLLGLNGSRSTQKFLVTRVADVDLTAMATEFARRDGEGRGVGALSPRDSAVVDVGGAHLAVDYGRPFARGRTIMGEVVPWGEVWRTGANAATGFTTTRDLEIGGVAVPAGSYTLWTLPTQEGWKLILNRQTGQWGTEYDAAQDLARIDMRVGRPASLVEQLTIRLEPTGANAGLLRLSWGDTEASVPFAVK